MAIVGFITRGLPGVRLISTDPVLQAALVTAAKLLVVVVAPFALWRAAWRYQVRDFVDLRAGLSGQWRALIVLSFALLALQALIGRARTDLGALHPTALELPVAVGLTSVGLFIEVGVVEEFFFRGLVQARASALMGSEMAGLVIMALVFGLAHAPGLYLRRGDRRSLRRAPKYARRGRVLHRDHLGDRVLPQGRLDSYSEPPVARANSHRWRPAAQPGGDHSPVEGRRLTTR